MNKYVLIPLALLTIPFVVAYMWIRHPILCFKEARRSFNMCMRNNFED